MATTREDILHIYAVIQREYRQVKQRRRKKPSQGQTLVVGSILDGPRKPLLVVIAPGAPSQFEQLGILTPQPELPGVWCGLGPFAELLYIGVRHLLPSDRRWDQLRWGYSASDSPDVDRTRFFSDPTVSPETRRKVQEMIMENKGYATESEHLSIYQQTIAKGEHVGEKRGRELGKRQMLLAVARETLSDEEFSRIEAISDLDEQRKAVTRLLKGTRK